MKLLSCIHNGPSRSVDFGVAAGDREVGVSGWIEGELGNAIGSEIVLYFLRLARDGLGELSESACHASQTVQRIELQGTWYTAREGDTREAGFWRSETRVSGIEMRLYVLDRGA